MEVQLLMLVGVLLPISTIGNPKQAIGPLVPHTAGQVGPGVFGNPYGQYYGMLLNYYRGLQNRGLLHANRHQQVGNPFLLNQNLALNGLRNQQQVANLAHVGYNIFQKKKDDYKYPTNDKYHNDKYPVDYYPGQKYPDGKYEYGPDKYPVGEHYKKNDKYPQKYMYDSVNPGHYDTYPGDHYPGGKYPDGKYPEHYGKEKYPTGDKYMNEKYPQTYDSTYPHDYHNDKYPKDYYPGEKYPDGKYSDKYPIGYGPDKYPTGDKYKKDDKYSQKYDSIYPHGPHNDKYSGTYYPGEKYPDGKYKDKYPKGHDKYPNSYPDRHYDTIYPSGPHYDGHYDGHKYPKDYPNDKYNDKYPNDYHNKGYNDRYPKDYNNDKYNDKYSKDPHYLGSDRHIRPNYLPGSNDPALEFGLPVSNLRGGIRGGVHPRRSGVLGGRSGLRGNSFLFANDIPEPVHSAATLEGGLLDLGPLGAGGPSGAGGRRLGGRHHYPVKGDKYSNHKDSKYDTYPHKDYHNPKKHVGLYETGDKYGPDHYKGPTYKKDYKKDKHGGHYKNVKSKKTY